MDLQLQAGSSWTCCCRQSSIHGRKTENPHSSSVVGRRQQEEGHRGGGGGRAWFCSSGNQSWLLFSKPTLGSGCWEALGNQGIINQCMCTPIRFHWKSTGIDLARAVVKIVFALHSGNAKVLHQITKFYRDASAGPAKATLNQKGLHKSPAPNTV